MALFNKPDTTNSITVLDGWVKIHNSDMKGKDARGDVVIPAGAISRVTNDDNLVKIHVDGVPQPAPKALDVGNHNRYAVYYNRKKSAEEVVAEVEAAMEAVRGVPVPEDWSPAPQSPKAVEQATKKSYEMWEAEKADNRRKAEAAQVIFNEAVADAQAKEVANAGDEPRFLKDYLVAEFGDVKLYSNHTIVFNGDNYPALGARGSIDAGLANNKKFSAGRIITGVAAAPLVGVFGLAGLIRKQKGQIVLEVELADGRLLVTVGPTKEQKSALKVVQALGKIPPAPAAPAPAQSAPTQAASVPAVDTDALTKLAELHKSGILTDEEFAAAKAKALGL